MKVKLTTLTPIHIGDGSIINPLSWVTQGRVLYIIDLDKFFALLDEKGKNEYVGWIESLTLKLSELNRRIDQVGRNYQIRAELKRKRREIELQLSLDEFIRQYIKRNTSQIIDKCAVYKVDFSVHPERNGFKGCVKNIQYRPYIPGSEIKGAIRTCLLYAMLKDKKRYEDFENLLKKFQINFQKGLSFRRKKKEFGRLSKDIEGKNLRGRKDDPKFDLFKLLSISDSSETSIVRLELTQMVGTGRYRYTKTWVETVPANVSLSFDLAINNSFPMNKKELLIQSLGFNELKIWLSPDKILEACYIRTKDILQNEKSYFKSYPLINKQISSLISQNQPTSPLLRVGAGQGFLGTTVNLHIKKNNPELYDRAIRDPVSTFRRWRTQSYNFPKTRRVITDSKDKPVNLLGWIKLYVE